MSKNPLHDWESQAAWVRSVVRSMVQDEHLAEDIAQDALVAGLGADAGAVANPRAWLSGVVRNQARQRWREQRRRRQREVQKGEVSRAEVEAAAEVAAREEIHQKVAEEVRSLPDPFRTTLLLHYFEEHSVRRIAANLGVPAKTVYSRLDAGRKVLRQRLRGRFGENWAMFVLPLAAPTNWRQTLAPASLFSHATRLIAVAAVLVVAALLAWSPADGWLRQGARPVTVATADANSEVTAVLPPPNATRTEIASSGTENKLEVRFEGFGAEVDFFWIRSDDWGSWKLNAAKLAVTYQDAIRAYGQPARADRQGQAWLPDGQRLSLLVVTDLGVARATWSPESGENPWIVSAEELVEAHAQVVDAEGVPAAGVQLGGIFSKDAALDTDHWADRHADLFSTDAEGRCRLLVHPEYLGSISVRGPIATQVRELGDEEEKDETLRLQLAPSGVVEVQLLDAHGDALGAQVPVRLQPAPLGFAMDGPGSLQHNTYSIGVFTDRHGVARFPWVGLGQQLRVTSILDANGSYDWVDFEGPKAQAQITRVGLAPKRERREFRARIIDREGNPLADRWMIAEMSYRSYGDASLQRSYLRTDANGVAHLPAGTGDENQRTDFLEGGLRIYLSGPDRTPWGAWVEVPARPSPGVHELEDIEVGRLPVALRVQILTPDGSPMGASYWILKRSPESPSGYWVVCNSSTLHKDELQVIREALPPGDYELHLTSRGFLTAIVPFRPGQPPFKVRMERAGRIRAELELGAQGPWGRWDFRAQSRPTEPPRGPADIGVGTAKFLSGNRLSVDIPVATPEFVRPLVEASAAGIPLWTGAPIQVGAGEDVDLGVIDLTANTHELKLRIVDPDGGRVLPERIRLDFERQSYWWRLTQEDRTAFSTLVPGPVGGEVWAHGYQSTRFLPQTGEVLVVLQPLPE